MKRILKYLMVLLIILGATNHTNAQINFGLSISIAPPALPIYTQRSCPGDGYMWTPGYWAYSDDGYYWVTDTWLLPPQFGVLWTPGFWGFNEGYYGWNEGYWGRHIGYYGGINYGCGYGGRGYGGGQWQGNTFRYNTAVNNINTTIIHNTYVNNTVINNNTIINNNRSSFNGLGGVTAKPTQREQIALKETHLKPTDSQLSNKSFAHGDKNQLASVNNGHPEKFANTSLHNNKMEVIQDHKTSKQLDQNKAQQVQKIQQMDNGSKNPQNIQHPARLPDANQQPNKEYQKMQAQYSHQNRKDQQIKASNNQQHLNQQHLNQQQKMNQQMNAPHQQMQQIRNEKNSGGGNRDNGKGNRESNGGDRNNGGGDRGKHR